MNDGIKFSVLVPVYNVEKYLADCIESVLRQTYGNFELILVDDGSPDASGKICDEYAAKDERIKVFHKPNGGALQSRCFGVERATGDYCVFVDSDDFIAEDCLELLLGYIERYGADCIIYGLQWLKPGGTEKVICHEAYYGRLITDKAELFRLVMCDEIYNSMCRKCARRACFDGRDLSGCYHIRRGEDRIQSEQILENAESFLFVPETPYFYRVNPGSVTHERALDGYVPDFTVEQRSLALIEKLGLFTGEDYDRLRNHWLDALVIDLKRFSRFCTSSRESRKLMARLRENSFYKAFLIKGYRKCSDVSGITISRGLRRRMNILLTRLLRLRCYGLILFICKHVFKSR